MRVLQRKEERKITGDYNKRLDPSRTKEGEKEEKRKPREEMRGDQKMRSGLSDRILTPRPL